MFGVSCHKSQQCPFFEIPIVSEKSKGSLFDDFSTFMVHKVVIVPRLVDLWLGDDRRVESLSLTVPTTRGPSIGPTFQNESYRPASDSRFWYLLKSLGFDLISSWDSAVGLSPPLGSF